MDHKKYFYIQLHLYSSLLYYCKYTFSTVDISLPELEYIANHLEPDECWKLVILLHSSSYEASNGTAPNRQPPVITDLNCLEQLLHWNSQLNEGFDETNDVLAHRLRQIDRVDLSDWLSKTVFDELSKELNKTLLSDPFKSLIVDENATTEMPDFVGNYSSRTVIDEDSWKPYDTILTVVVVFLFVTCIILGYHVIRVSMRNRPRKISLSDFKENVPLVTQEQISNTRRNSSASEPP